MKKIVFLFSFITLAIVGLSFYSCQKGEENESKLSEEAVTLKFELANKKIREVKTKIAYINKVPTLVSDELKEIIVKHKNTGKKISVFILKETDKNSKLLALSKNVVASSERGNCQPQMNRGYGFDGRCFSYGTFIITNNCEQYFYPAPITEYVGFDRVCPDWNGAFARDNQTFFEQ